MKRALALLLVLLAGAPAQAHFIWILPDKDKTSARMVFSDDLAPDANVPITKIAQTKLFGRDAKGAAVSVTSKEGKDAYQLATEAEGIVEIGGVCHYGVLAKGKAAPFLLMYYAKTIVADVNKGEPPAHLFEGWSKLPLEIVPAKERKRALKVLFQGKPAANVEVVLIVPGVEKSIERKTDDMGLFDVERPEADGTYGVRTKLVEAKEGELDGKKYKEIRHYATLTVNLKGAKKATEKAKEVSFVDDAPKADAAKADAPKADAPKADPGATKLLADARAARAVWNNFPGFTSDLTVNHDGKLHKGTLAVTGGGKVKLTLDDKELEAKIRREIGSLVSHRLPGGPRDTPCGYTDSIADHPLGRSITVLNDELHSVYRIKDRQIIEVNRQMENVRFTITVLENTWNKEKQCLPVSYVVNTWDTKTKVLKSSISHHQTWTRMGDFDLPVTLLTVRATPDQLESHQLTFSNTKLSTASADNP